MSRIEASTRDLRLMGDGDLDFDNLDIQLVSDGWECAEQSLTNRIVYDSIDWGNELTDAIKDNFLTLARNSAEAFYKPCANVRDFVGSRLDSETLVALRTSIQNAFLTDGAFRDIDLRVTVTRLTESIVSISIVAKVDFGWYMSSFGGADWSDQDWMDMQEETGFFDKVLITTMNYDTSSDIMNISSIDIAERSGV